MSNELETKEVYKPMAPMSGTEQLIQTAIQTPQFDPKAFQMLLEQKRIEEDREAERAFLKAKAFFQRDCPEVKHDKTGSTKTMSWTYASIGLVEATVKPHCAKHGLSYHWTEREGRQYCILAHRDGHREESSFTLSREGQQGAISQMTRQQQEGGTDTYARGRTLTAVLGIGTAQQDLGGAEPATGKQSEDRKSHIETCKKIRDDWLKPRHELHGKPDVEKHRCFGAWFISCTDAKVFSPAVNRWTSEQLVQCRNQLDREAAAVEYAKGEKEFVASGLEILGSNEAEAYEANEPSIEGETHESDGTN